MKQAIPDPNVTSILQKLLAEVQRVLGAQLKGLYLYGSLASGDFSLLSSDIDFVVTTQAPLPADTITALGMMHEQLTNSGLKWASKLEGSYITQAALRRYQPEAGPWPTLNEGRFYVAPHGRDWVIQRHILRQHGVTLFGPPVASLLDPVTADDLKQAVTEILREWWEPMLQEPAFVQRREYQAFAVLTMCRALYTLRLGDVVSKPAAARWALVELPGRWAVLIEQALAWPLGSQPDSLDETLAFIAYTVAVSQNVRGTESTPKRND
ncbi:MAG: DUF4111 domain-containing protein [Chloroflexota bacterium]